MFLLEIFLLKIQSLFSNQHIIQLPGRYYFSKNFISDMIFKVHRIHAILGTPSEKVLNKFHQFRNRQIPWDFPEVKGNGIERGIGSLLSRPGIKLLYKLVKYDPDERITARQALRSDWCHETIQTMQSSKKSLDGNLLFVFYPKN
jgi:serine/threonine protein kinase